MKIIGTDALYFDTNFQALTQLIFLYNAERHATERGVEVVIDHNHPAVTLQLIFAWITAGGEVEDYPCFIRFSETAFAKNVNDFVPNATTLNDDEVEVPVKWADWKASNFNDHPKYGDYYYVPSDAIGYPLKGSILKQLHDLSGVNVVTVQDFKDAQPEVTGV